MMRFRCMGMNGRVNIYMIPDMKSNVVQVCTLPKKNTQCASQNNKLGTDGKDVIFFNFLQGNKNN